MDWNFEYIQLAYKLYCNDVYNGVKGITYKKVIDKRVPLPVEYFFKNIKYIKFVKYYNIIIMEMRNDKINKIKCKIN